MFRFVVIAFIVLYLIPPFLLLLDYPFQIFQLMIIYSFFGIGCFIAYLQKKNAVFINYSDRFLVSPRVFFFVSSIFFITKFSYIVALSSSIKSGDFLEYALSLAVERYEGHNASSNYGLVERFGEICFLMSGSLVAAISHHKRKAHLILIIMVILQSVSLSRLGVLLVFVGYSVEYVIRKNAEIQALPLRKLVYAGVIVTLILGVIFFASAVGRVSDKDNLLEILVAKTGSYTLAMYEALLIWMRENTNHYGSTFGSLTLAGLFKVFGAVYIDGFYGVTETRFGPTNIYLNIRGFLSDFGVVGTSLFLFIWGYYLTYFSKRSLTVFSYYVTRILFFMLFFVLFSPMMHLNTMISLLLSGVIIAGVKWKANA